MTFIRRPVVVLAVICLAAFTAILDTSVVGLMLPLIGRDLHSGVAELAWVANAYVLTYAVLLASAGVLGDRSWFWRRGHSLRAPGPYGCWLC